MHLPSWITNIPLYIDERDKYRPQSLQKELICSCVSWGNSGKDDPPPCFLTPVLPTPLLLVIKPRASHIPAPRTLSLSYDPSPWFLSIGILAWQSNSLHLYLCLSCFLFWSFQKSPIRVYLSKSLAMTLTEKLQSKRQRKQTVKINPCWKIKQEKVKRRIYTEVVEPVGLWIKGLVIFSPRLLTQPRTTLGSQSSVPGVSPLGTC